MKTFIAFIKKEITEHIRSSKLAILFILFVCFGIMNPAVAKLTPWMLELMADSMAESGFMITGVEITAMDSWVQFFKNIPMALIIFLLFECSIFTKEYQSGTLVLTLTKGLQRCKVVISKALVAGVLWSAFYYICFAITYAYNAYFWDNSVAQNLSYSVFCWWLFGLWTIALMVFFSTISFSVTGVLTGVCGAVILSTVLGLVPKIKSLVPTALMDGNSLIYGTAKTEDYLKAVIITAVLSAVLFALSIPVFNKKQL